MESETTPPTNSYAIGLSGVFRALFIGAGVGIAGWLLTLFFRNIVIENIFCRSADTFAICSNGGTIAWNIAFVIVSLASVFILMRIGMYRPLLIVLAAMVTLWGIAGWLLPMIWWQSMLWSGVLFGLAYALFAWLASHTVFVVSLVSSVIAVILIRLISAI